MEWNVEVRAVEVVPHWVGFVGAASDNVRRPRHSSTAAAAELR